MMYNTCLRNIVLMFVFRPGTWRLSSCFHGNWGEWFLSTKLGNFEWFNFHLLIY